MTLLEARAFCQSPGVGDGMSSRKLLSSDARAASLADTTEEDEEGEEDAVVTLG